MKTLSFCSCLTIACLLFIGCSKSSDTPTNTNAELIAKWNFIRGVEVDSADGYVDSVTLNEGSYLNFDNNGICYSLVDGTQDSGNWKFINNNKGVYIEKVATFIVPDVNFDIAKLDEHNLVLVSNNIPGLVETFTLTK